MTTPPPRRPGRPAGPRGKIRIAGSGPATGKTRNDPDDNAVDTNAAETTKPAETKPADFCTGAAPAAPEPTAASSKTSREPATTSETDDAESAGDTGDTVVLDKPTRKPRPTVKGASLKKPGQPEDPDRDTAGVSPARRSADGAGSGGFLTWRKVATVAAIAAVFAILAVVLAFKPGAKTETNDAFLDAAATSELKAQAGDRMCTVLGVDPVDFDGWAAKAKSALTGEYINEFNEYLQANRDLATQTGQGAECKVDLIGISNMDDTRANVIGTFVLSNTQQGVAVLGTPNLARVDVGLEKVNGQWLISRISDF